MPTDILNKIDLLIGNNKNIYSNIKSLLEHPVIINQSHCRDKILLWKRLTMVQQYTENIETQLNFLQEELSKTKR